MALEPLPAAKACWICLLIMVPMLRADMGQFFVRNPEPIIAPPGDEVGFECSLRMVAEQIRWLHDGHFVQSNSSNHSGMESGKHSNHSSKSSHLVVRVEDAKQAGDYQCVAWFGASAWTSAPARLSLAELHSFPHQDNQTFDVTAGNTVAIRCDPPYSMPPALLQYYRNGERLKASVPVLETTGTLVLQNVTVHDAGSYHCTANNYITGQTTSSGQHVTLNVKAPNRPVAPHFLSPPQTNYTVRTGDNVTLECSAVGNPTPTTTWQKYGGQLLQERATMVPGGLHLIGVGLGDEGTYVCMLSNGAGPSLTHVIALHLQEPPVVLKVPPNKVVQEGGEVFLECQVKGSPTPHLTWIFNGESVVNDMHMKIIGGKLHITEVEKRHAGIFQCFVSNPLGNVSGSTMLQVSPKQIPAQPSEDSSGDHGQPVQDPTDFGTSFTTQATWNRKKEQTRKGNGKRKEKHKHKDNDVMIPPTRPNVTRLSDTSVMVRWDVPRNNGLSIQFFKVQHRELSKGRRKSGTRRRGDRGDRWKTNNEDIPPHIRSYEVDTLRTDHTYRFRIAAVYINDDNMLGPNSAKFHLHRGNNNALSPPKLVRTEALGPSSIQIHWQYTSSARVAVEGFYVYYRAASTAGHYIQATVEGERQRSFNITRLAPDTAYEMKLQSFTVDAASNFSAILTQKTMRLPTEMPPLPEVVIPNLGKVDTASGQLYVVLGAVLGGLVLLSTVFLGVFMCNRYRISTGRAAQDSSQMEPVTRFGKNLLNGRLPQNGYLQNSKMNITSNPLAESDEDKNQNVVEISFLSNQNNNCSASGSGSGDSSSSEASGRTGDGPAGDDNPCPDPEATTCEVKSWRGAAASPGENYV